MRIALISSAEHNPNTGVSGTRLAFQKALQDLGVEVDTYFMDDLKSFSGGLLDRIIFPFKVALRIKKWREYDLIDVASGDGWALTYMRNRPTIVFSSHGLEHLAHEEILKESKEGNINLSWKYPIYWGGYRLWEVSKAIKKSEFSIVLNKNDKDYVVSQFGVAEEKVNIVQNGVPEYFLNQEFNKEKLDRKIIRIAQVGSYIQRKGIDYSSEVLNKILTKYSNVEVTFFGTGCSKERVLKDYDPQLTDRISIVEKYDHRELPKYLENFHINLFPSLSEGFGKTLIECMACGLAPITFETPGPLDIVTDGYDGIIVPKRNTKLLQESLEELITNHELLNKIQYNAYLTANRYSWETAAKTRLDVYKKALYTNSQTHKTYTIKN
ncbi:glycosyltransferase family 4 protein [Evansella sp. AB-rgal1]|uniref:glycosyltransferase family 4 protein n=1 Tax=Evansella sp. AB-rgal1 TaxID=3242696 RepID=UPI00359D07FA